MKKKIGIITIHSDIHYGAALQAFALNYVLSESYDCEIINYVKIPTNLPKFSLPKMLIYHLANFKKTRRFRKFLRSSISKETYLTSESIMNGFIDKYDVVVTGSDQVWNPKVGGYDHLNPVYFNAFVKDKKVKKISYASSIGNYVFNNNEVKDVKKWLGEYEHISTREEFGKVQLEEILKRKVNIVLDPTLLMTGEQWRGITRKPSGVIVNYVLVYNVGSKLEKDAEYARLIANRINCKVVFTSVKLKRDKNVDRNIAHCGPKEFLWLFDNAEFVVTSSFHGVAFSINLNKNFLNVYNPKSPQRIDQLLDNVGLQNRSVKSLEEAECLPIDIEYKDVNEKLQSLRNNSMDYLVNAVES